MTLALIIKMLKERVASTEANRAQAEKMLKNAPGGNLRVKKTGKRTMYYLCGTSDESKPQYLSNDQTELIKDLEEKAYLQTLVKNCKEEEEVLNNTIYLLESLKSTELTFQNIPLPRRHLIEPLDFGMSDSKVASWLGCKRMNKGYKGPGHLVTKSGQKVRSKSEVIIADRLFAEGIPFFYEPSVLIEATYWYPDFMVLNKRTGKTYYWEHFGMIDDPKYCVDFQVKIENYEKVGIIQGENFLITTESSEYQLRTQQVDFLIERYLK